MPQSLSNVIVHLVFSTKNRTAWLKGDMRDETCAYLVGILRDIGCVPIQFGGHEDHVHLLFAMTRTKSMSQVVEEAKTGSSRWMKTKGIPNFAWQSGYAVFSVSMDDVSSVVKYIKNQDEHHGTVSFEEEFRALMKDAAIEIDESYVWD